MLKGLGLAAALILIVTVSGCVILIDSDDSDGDTGVTVKSIGDYKDDKQRDENAD